MDNAAHRERTDSWTSREGSPFPLGVTYVASEEAFNFAIYSKHAERVTLVMFDREDPCRQTLHLELDFLRNKSGSVWHCRIPKYAADGSGFYAYRVDGPLPAGGFEFHQFDYEKLLVDPYAHTIYFPPGFDRAASSQPGSNLGKVPLAVLPPCECVFHWGDDLHPRHESQLVIYELHIRGLTQHASSGVAPSRRGTFLGACEKIPYLQQLGVTAVELMPVFQFDTGDGNYWGYMPLSLFAPHNAYATAPSDCNQRDEFRSMVKAFHAAGIEVLLDVVYNHTCEGDIHGPTYSFKGIDNSTYYMMCSNPANPYANFSGTGNTLHTANGNVRRLIVDSMRYWVEHMHVDGFRFDLASIFTRNSDGSINLHDPPIIGQIGAEDDLANVRLVAEPWDASGAFQLGHSFPGVQWMQWNSQYRDCVQKFVRGDSGMVPDLMTRLYGSCDLFPDDRMHAYHPHQSVNYVASHDGLSMADLVAYSHKNNWANGHQNRDGHDDFSCNSGWEGNADVPASVLVMRRQQVKNFFCLLMLSAGTPMFRMGDEFMHTQNGNSNPYNQDNETSWLDWSKATSNREVLRFVTKMIAFRKSHPSISRSRFWRDDISWHGKGHAPDLSYDSRCLAYFLDGKSESDSDLYVMINGGDDAATFGIHRGAVGQWRRVVDTAAASPNDITDEGSATVVNASSYDVSPQSIVVLVGRTGPHSAR